MTEEKIDLVNHPAHYEKYRIVLEPVDLTEPFPTRSHRPSNTSLDRRTRAPKN